MKLLYSSFLLVTCTVVQAQTFLNGSFETNTAYSCDYNLINSTFNSKISNCNAYGAGNEIDIMSSCSPYCSFAQSGTWCISLANSSGSAADAITMTLSAPLVSGASYMMSFWDHGDESFTYEPSPIQIGVSTTNNATGTVVYTGPTPAYGHWKMHTFTFTAPNSGQYISVSATTLRWTQIDNFSIASLLPIQLVSFTGEAINGQVNLNWSTESEMNNDYFTIERSSDGVSFIPVITEYGAGTSIEPLNYSASDLHPLQGKNYYRLSQTDYNGTTIVFHTIEVIVESVTAINPSLFPNPTTGIVRIENIDPSMACTVSICNLLGQQIEPTKEIPDAVLDLRSLRRGIYLLHIQQQDQCWSDFVVKE